MRIFHSGIIIISCLTLSLSLTVSLSLPSELIGGTPSLKINHGSGTLVLQLTNNIGVADRRWHRLDVRSNNKVRDVHLWLRPYMQFLPRA